MSKREYPNTPPRGTIEEEFERSKSKNQAGTSQYQAEGEMVYEDDHIPGVFGTTSGAIITNLPHPFQTMGESEGNDKPGTSRHNSRREMDYGEMMTPGTSKGRSVPDTDHEPEQKISRLYDYIEFADYAMEEDIPGSYFRNTAPITSSFSGLDDGKEEEWPEPSIEHDIEMDEDEAEVDENTLRRQQYLLIEKRLAEQNHEIRSLPDEMVDKIYDLMETDGDRYFMKEGWMPVRARVLRLNPKGYSTVPVHEIHINDLMSTIKLSTKQQFLKGEDTWVEPNIKKLMNIPKTDTLVITIDEKVNRDNFTRGTFSQLGLAARLCLSLSHLYVYGIHEDVFDQYQAHQPITHNQMESRIVQTIQENLPIEQTIIYMAKDVARTLAMGGFKEFVIKINANERHLQGSKINVTQNNMMQIFTKHLTDELKNLNQKAKSQLTLEEREHIDTKYINDLVFESFNVKHFPADEKLFRGKIRSGSEEPYQPMGMPRIPANPYFCLLYTSDAADDM
jgi:hypothetical protein